MSGNDLKSLLCISFPVRAAAAVGRHAASVFVSGGREPFTACQTAEKGKGVAFRALGV